MVFASWMPRLEAEVRRVGAFALAGSQQLRPDDIQSKPGDEASLVTRYDVECEAMLRDFVRREFPGHSFLGEEQGNERRDPSHYWIVDPIDGTTNFTLGIPFWGVSVGYWLDGEPLLGLIYFPALDQMFTAVRGGGAHQNGVRIHTGTDREYSMRNGVALHSRTHLTHTLRLRTKVRVLGSAVVNMCYTARGTFVACYAQARLWDVGAGIPILREAGAVIETQPDVASFDLATYTGMGRGESFRLYAQANADLPPLASFLQPAPAPSAEKRT